MPGPTGQHTHILQQERATRKVTGVRLSKVSACRAPEPKTARLVRWAPRSRSVLKHQFPSLVARGSLRFDHSMNFTRINMSAIPDDVLFLLNVIVLAVIVLFAALFAVTHLVDKAKDRRSKDNARDRELRRQKHEGPELR
jgi:hypothetical protein